MTYLALCPACLRLALDLVEQALASSSSDLSSAPHSFFVCLSEEPILL
jgi:hypothetical protein